jgi:tight adherence protein B
MRASRRGDSSSFLTGLYEIDVLQRLEERMWQAGIYFAVSDILLIIVLMFGAGLAAGEALWGELPFALAMALGLGALPLVYIRIRRERRLKAFVRQLPPALDLIKSSLEAGHSLLRGLQVVVDEFPDPIGSEFRSVIEQSRLCRCRARWRRC